MEKLDRTLLRGSTNVFNNYYYYIVEVVAYELNPIV